MPAAESHQVAWQPLCLARPFSSMLAEMNAGSPGRLSRVTLKRTGERIFPESDFACPRSASTYISLSGLVTASCGRAMRVKKLMSVSLH